MFRKIGGAIFFVWIFNSGLLLLFAGIFREYFFAPEQMFFFRFGVFSFFAAGASICLISLIFLFTEWVILPPGAQNKRTALYQGAGNLFALAMLVSAYLLVAEQSPLNLARFVPFSFGSCGIFIAAVFAVLGKPIAGGLCRKKINMKIPIVRARLDRPDAAKNLNDSGTIAQPLKIPQFMPEAR